MLEEHRRQGGKGEIERVRPAVAGDRCGFNAPQIAVASATVVLRIAVAHFLPEPAAWRPDTIIEAGGGGEITHDEYQVIGQMALAETTDHARRRVVAIDPFEPRWVSVEFVEGRLAAVEPIQVFQPALQTDMRGVLTEVPIKALVMIPFSPLAELP